MSANVETMMYAGEVPWHGLGTSLPLEVSSEEAIRLSGLDWDVELASIVTDDQKRTGVDQYRVTRRTTDNLILGVVKSTFKPIQNRAAFGMFDGVVGTGRAIYHTAGALQNGSKVWILAKLPGAMVIGGKDEVDRYLLLSNAHDGTRPLQMLFTPVRVVCANTLGVALGRRKEDMVEDEGGEEKEAWDRWAPRVAIRQNAKAEQKMKEAERCMKKALQYYEKFGDFANFLASTQLRNNQVGNIVAEVFPPNKKKELTPTIMYHRGEVFRLFEEGKGHDQIAGSAWALFNAFAEYADHSWAFRSVRTDDSTEQQVQDRSYSVWMGGARSLKQRATKSLVTLLT